MKNQNNSDNSMQEIRKLTSSIITVSYHCGQVFKEPIDNKYGEDSKEAITSFMQVQYEFLFFFAHLAMRSAFSKLGHNKRVKLQQLIGPILEISTTEAWFGHWPEHLKAGIRKDFYNNLNVAELEYSKCHKLLGNKNESPKDTLFWELGKNIARLSGCELDIAVIMQCMDVSLKYFLDMNLDDLIVAAGEDL